MKSFIKNLIFMLLLIAFPLSLNAQMVKVTGNGVVLDYVKIDCGGQNEFGMVVSGTGFVGKQLSSQNCVAGGLQFNQDATLKNSLAFSDGADIIVANGKIVIGTNNLFGDANTLGVKYSDISSTTLWSGSYGDRINSGKFIVGFHDVAGQTDSLGTILQPILGRYIFREPAIGDQQPKSYMDVDEFGSIAEYTIGR